MLNQKIKLVVSISLLVAGFFGGIITKCADAATVTYNLTAMSGTISEADGGQVYMWGFTDNGQFRYPGPTIDVMAGDTVVVNLTNNIIDKSPDPVSMVFPGQVAVSNQGPTYTTVGDPRTLRSMAAEAAPNGGSVQYTFTPANPGTYYYQSGTNPQKQIDMGLFGAIIVRPTGFDATKAVTRNAYGNKDTYYDSEALLLMSAVDPVQHKRVEMGLPYQATNYLPAYWFINGRSYPDTIKPNNVSDLLSQPMTALIPTRPNDRVLFRFVTFDRDMHPLHHHGENANIIAHNGRVLSTGNSNNAILPDLSPSVNNETVHPGETFDSIFVWDEKDLGWDIYGHTGGGAVTGEDKADHPLGLPVQIPSGSSAGQNLVWGDLYSGTPFMGTSGDKPVGMVNLNPGGANFMIFHSHHEVEIQNFDTPGAGGMLTFIMIQPY